MYTSIYRKYAMKIINWANWYILYEGPHNNFTTCDKISLVVIQLKEHYIEKSLLLDAVPQHIHDY